jgi:hypothetical protein
MRVARTIIVPAVLALGVAGSLLSGSAISAAAAHPASANVQAISLVVVYHG